MVEASHRWVPGTEPDALVLEDLVSGRSVRIGRPAAGELAGELLADAEPLVFRWANLVTQAEAERDARALAEDGPLPLLHALSWLLAFWAVTCECRFGTSAADIIPTVDYHGPWRRDGTPEEAQIWESLTQRVRIGALAALTEDPRAAGAYHRAATEPPSIGVTLIRHTLILLDGFSQDMRLHGVPPRGLLRSFVDATTPPPGPRQRPCFAPPTRSDKAGHRRP